MGKLYKLFCFITGVQINSKSPKLTQVVKKEETSSDVDSVEDMKAKLSTPPPKPAGRKRRKVSTDNQSGKQYIVKRTIDFRTMFGYFMTNLFAG